MDLKIFPLILVFFNSFTKNFVHLWAYQVMPPLTYLTQRRRLAQAICNTLLRSVRSPLTLYAAPPLDGASVVAAAALWHCTILRPLAGNVKVGKTQNLIIQSKQSFANAVLVIKLCSKNKVHII